MESLLRLLLGFSPVAAVIGVHIVKAGSIPVELAIIGISMGLLGTVGGILASSILPQKKQQTAAGASLETQI
jgi:hypothetical protein